jgi:hypothetical protein
VTQATGLDYFKQSDAWQGSHVLDWNKIDLLVQGGNLTPEERDLLHAYGSMVVLTDGQATSGFPEVDNALQHYYSLKDTVGATPEFTDQSINRPDITWVPKEGDDYYSQVPPGKWGGQQLPPAVPDKLTLPAPGGAGNGALAVNTEALQLFGGNMLTLRDFIRESMTYVALIDVKPGVFYKGLVLRDKVMGDPENNPGLWFETYQFMDNTAEAMVDLYHDLRKLTADYDTVEELNGMGADKLKVVMNESFGTIDKSKSFGNSQGSNGATGGSGSGNGNGNGNGNGA